MIPAGIDRVGLVGNELKAVAEKHQLVADTLPEKFNEREAPPMHRGPLFRRYDSRHGKPARLWRLPLQRFKIASNTQPAVLENKSIKPRQTGLAAQQASAAPPVPVGRDHRAKLIEIGNVVALDVPWLAGNQNAPINRNRRRLPPQGLVENRECVDAIRRVIAAHMFNHGWPAAEVGGSGDGNFDIPDEIEIVDATAHFDTDINGKLADVGPPTFSRAPDIRYRADINGDDLTDNTDMFADIWVTYLDTRICPGCSAQTNAATAGNSASTGGSHTFLDIRASGTAPGDAEQLTGAEFRALVRN